MTLNDRLFTITFTEKDVMELHELLNDFVKHLRSEQDRVVKEEHDLSKGATINEKLNKAKDYRNEFARLVNVHYMGIDA